jgi:hypothetical protein
MRFFLLNAVTLFPPRHESEKHTRPSDGSPISSRLFRLLFEERKSWSMKSIKLTRVGQMEDYNVTGTRRSPKRFFKD